MIAVCLASGPSLTPEDVERVRQWRAMTGDLVIVVNTTFRVAPWADILYAMDSAWWKAYAEEIRDTFTGRLVAPSSFNVPALGRRPEIVRKSAGRNSGMGAILLAHSMAAKKCILLGYDAKWKGDKRHHHADHPPTIGNANSVKRWPGQARETARRIPRMTVINCSRETAITVWTRGTIETELPIEQPARKTG